MNTLNFPVGEIFKFKMETYIGGASLVAQLVKNPPAMQETPVQSPGWEDPLEILPGESHGQRCLVGYIQSMGSQRVGHD